MSRLAPSRPGPPVAKVWLATPEAAGRFDPSLLTDADRGTWAAIRTPRRRLDWESSRALQGAVAGAGNQRRSLSHSHGYAALALAPGSVAVGVDLEWLVPRNFSGMADVAYSAAESAHIATLDDPAEACSTFYELWTLKEAFGKALRLHLADALRLCCFIASPGMRHATVPTSHAWRARVYAPRPQLRLAVVHVNESPAPILEGIDTMEWPLPRTREWLVVRDLKGSGNRGGNAC